MVAPLRWQWQTAAYRTAVPVINPSLDVAGSKDSVLNSALVQYNYPTEPGGQTSVEFAINPAKAKGAFAGDLPDHQVALIAVTQRPIAAVAFSDVSGSAAWKKPPTPTATMDTNLTISPRSVSGCRHGGG
jgi:hypothetical protein